MPETVLNNPPLISIIMPTHNAGRYIGKAIQSVLDQTYSNWELLIIDDASSDNTAEVVRSFNDSRIQYHRVERIGHPAGVRNKGLSLAQGEFIAFLDSDDLYFKRTLEKLSRPLLHNQALTSVYGFAYNIDEHDNPLPQSIHLIPKPSPQSPDEPDYDLPPDYGHSWKQIVTSKISNMLAALMLRRSAQQEIGLFNEDLCGPEDYEFYVRMFLHNYEGVLCLSDYMYQYRIHSASLTKAPEHCQRLLNSCLKIMDWMFHKAPIPPQAHAFKSQAYVACYRYLARERLLHHQPHLARQIALQALEDKNVHPVDFIKQCSPILIRSFLPPQFDHQLVQLRMQLRNASRHTRPQPLQNKVAATPCP
jgi:GT2 family glycosyltransferase